MKFFSFLVCLFLSTHSFSQKIVERPDKNVPDLTPTNAYIVFPYNASNPVLRSVFPERVRKATLDTNEIEEVDALLKKCIDNFNLTQELAYDRMLEVDSSTNRAEFFINLATYQRQFVPVINETTRQKEVWVNAFCYVRGVDKWKHEIIKEDEGGKCFFNLKVNLTRKTFYGFTINLQ